MPRPRKGIPSVTSTPSSATRQTNLYMTCLIFESISVASYKLEDGYYNTGRLWRNNFKNPFGWAYPNTFVIALKHACSRIQVHPTLPLMTPFPIELIIDTAKHVYNPTCFDQETDEASEDDSDDSDTDSDSDLEEEEMCSIPKKEKKKKKTELKAKEQKAKDQVPSTFTPPSQRHVHFSQDKTDEIADLIDRLGKMSISDPNYNVLYFLITSRAPHTRPFLKLPPQNQDGSTVMAHSLSQPHSLSQSKENFCNLYFMA